MVQQTRKTMVYVPLKKALYGTPQAALLFRQLLSQTLVGHLTQPILQMCGKQNHQQQRMCNYMDVNHLKYQI